MMRRVGYQGGSSTRTAVVATMTLLRNPAVTALKGTTSSSSSIMSVLLPTMTTATQRRNASSYVLYRKAPVGLIPTRAIDPTDPEGKREITVDEDAVMSELAELSMAVYQSMLCDNMQEMKQVGYLDGIIHDTMIFGQPGVLVMPKRGIEHRSAEMSETVRYLRSLQMTQDLLTFLQDEPKAKAKASDFIAIGDMFLMSYGTSRTNEIAYDMCHNAHAHLAGGTKGMIVNGFEAARDAPPLNTYCAYAGDRNILVTDDEHGARAEYFIEMMNDEGTLGHSPLRIESGCQFVSWSLKNNTCLDVIVDEAYPESMDRMARCGLNPIPVKWDECKKIGLSMRNYFFHAPFTMSGWDASVHGHHDDMAKGKESHRRHYGKTHSHFGEQDFKRHGTEHDTEASFTTNIMQQLQNGEIPQPQQQPTPRYRPRMHDAKRRERQQRLTDGLDDPAGEGIGVHESYGKRMARLRQAQNKRAKEEKLRLEEEAVRADEDQRIYGTSRFDIHGATAPEEYKGLPPEMLGKEMPTYDSTRSKMPDGSTGNRLKDGPPL